MEARPGYEEDEEIGRLSVQQPRAEVASVYGLAPAGRNLGNLALAIQLRRSHRRIRGFSITSQRPFDRMRLCFQLRVPLALY
jgi:hypothetical protein